MSNIGQLLTPYKTGKVRNIYEVNGNLIIVASDRISAFDYILPQDIPGKGKVLNQLSLFWFDYLKNGIKNHLITADVAKYPSPANQMGEALKDRSMLVLKADIIPFECVARGYLEGSGWKDYQQTGSICGIKLPSGLKRGDCLPEPIFTPATKAETGHDINIDFKYMTDRIGERSASRLKEYTINLYTKAAEFAIEKGIIIADTKFEFGYYNGDIILADEVLTPDSSRFWPLNLYKPGGAQPSFDKQFVRDYLEKIKWDKKPPIPDLPSEIVQMTREKYLEAYRRLIGKEPGFI